MPEVALDRLVKHFVIADGRLQKRVPINQSLAAIDQLFLNRSKKEVPDGSSAHIVQRETHALPITAGSQLLQLAEDAGFVLLFPFPDAADQLLAAQIVAGLALLFAQTPFDNGLRGDAGVVRAGHPQRVEALHPFAANDMSCSVLFSACPRCKAPVTFGGGMTIVNGWRSGSGSLWK